MAKLLVVDDDAGTAALLVRGLTEAGHQVRAAADGLQGLQLLGAGSFDLVVLDAMMPARDGWSTLEDIRKAGLETPVLMLSALDAPQYRIRGLALGADDYLAKPFSFEELALRIEAICRRVSRRSTEQQVGFAGLSLDGRGKSALREGAEIALSAKEYELLRLLIVHHGSVLSKQFIAREVWDMHIDADSNVVEVNIRRLRQKIDEPFQRKLIHTMRGRGYVLR